MKSSASVIEVTALNKTFTDFWRRPSAKAVQNLSFDVRPGEVYGLLGPNGSGKSTTIKMMLGLLHPTSGEIKVLGQTPTDVKTKARVGYLPEESYLYPYLDARESLLFYGSLFGLDRRVCHQRATELLEMVGLKHTGKRRVGEFSKGMARRIGLAQALINDPDVVILDEPTSGLDPLGTRQVKDIILALAERGKTVLLCSHLLADVQDVCDRIQILYGGVSRANGPIRELLHVANTLHLQLPELTEAQKDRVVTSLTDILGSTPDLRPASRDLETFFLEVVAQARRENDQSSGAAGEGAVASFLSGATSGS